MGGTTVLVVSGFLFLDWREGGREGAVGVLGRLGASGAGVEERVDVLEPPSGGNRKSIFEAMLPPLPYWAVRPGYAHNREDGVPCINS